MRASPFRSRAVLAVALVAFGGAAPTIVACKKPGCVIGGMFFAPGTVDPSNACEVCRPSTSTTAWSNRANGTTCDDGNICTVHDQCMSGTCVGTVAPPGTSCGTGLECNGTSCVPGCSIGGVFYMPGAIDPANGCKVCTPAAADNAWSNESDGTTCNDGNACTQGDVCHSGVCKGATPVVCNKPPPCHVAAGAKCHPATGCSYPVATNGTACNDGNECTQTDTCHGGACIGSNPVVCGASDACHAAGTCSPTTGLCSNPNQPDGTACNDSNACTQTDLCESGVCTGSNPVACNTPPDTCHTTAGATCNPANGTCDYPAAPNGTACNDGNACTQTDACQGGVCAGSNPVVCKASDGCHAVGTCNPASGACSNPNLADGALCTLAGACPSEATCAAGVCGGASGAQPPVPAVCGDGYRDPLAEECDIGSANGIGVCSATCRVADDVLSPPLGDATFGGQPHPSAFDAEGFATGFALGSSPPTELDVAFFDALGRPIATRAVSVATTLFPAGTGIALAPLTCGTYAAAWTDYNGDGDAAGVALRRIDSNAAPVGAPGHANAGTAFNQVLQDMIWTGNELVVVWGDDGDLSSLGELKMRTFDASLTPTSADQILAHTSGLSTSAVLAPFAGSWAASWLSFDVAGPVSVVAQAGSTNWTAATLPGGAVVDTPALIDLDATHLLVVYAASVSASNPTTLEGAILDLAAPGSAVPIAITPTVAPANAELRQPSLTRVGSRVFLSWLSNTNPPNAEPLPGDVWLKELDLGATPGTIDTSQPEIALPRATTDANGMEDTPALALSLPGAPQTLLAGWHDHSGPGVASHVLVEAIPLPLLRKVGP